MEFLQKFWKAILIILAITLLIVLIAFLAYVMHWSFVKVIFILLGVAATVLAIWGGYRLWRWYRQYRAERDAREAASPSIQRKLDKLDNIFKNAVRRIKKAKLRAKGDPLYVLPWYMLIGPQGCGKTTALKNSRVSIPLLEGAQAGDPADDFCQWWLMEESIVVETPSRYMYGNDEETIAEWKRFLHLFGKYRTSLPLNGLVVALPADALVSDGFDRWLREAEVIRSRITEIMKATGVRIPVYFMLTKLDRLAGATKFFERFPESVLTQAMGTLISGGNQSDDPLARIKGALSQVKKSLDDMRYSVLTNCAADEIRAAELIFPEDVARLNETVARLATIIFDKEHYEEAPVFRGIYYTSGLQEGTQVTAFARELPSATLTGPANAQARSYFLRGFLGTVLKQEKNIAVRTVRALNLLALRHNLGLVAWVGVCIAAGLLLTGAFFSNLKVINQASTDLPATLAVKNKLDAELQSLSAIRATVEKIEASNRNSWLTRALISRSSRTGEQLAAEHNRRLERILLQELEPAYNAMLDHIVEDRDPTQLANYIDFMTRRIKLAHLTNEEDYALEQLLEGYQPNATVMGELLKLSSPELSASVSAAYTAYVHWSSEKQNDLIIKQERTRLENLLKNPEIGLAWLIEWANMQPTIEDVTTHRYWDVEATGDRAAKVSRAFTPEGWAAIKDFLVEIERVVKDKETLSMNRKAFMEEYKGLYFLAWREYMAKFDSGATAFATKDKRQKLAILITGKDTPYLKFLNDLPNVLAPVLAKSEDDKKETDDQEDTPSWVNLSIQFAKMSDPAYLEQAKGGNKMVSKLVKKGASMLGKAGKLAVKAAKGKKKKEATEEQLATLVSQYQENIGKLGQQTKSMPAAFEMSKVAFAEAGTIVGEPQAVPNKIDWELQQLEESMGDGDAEEDVVWKFLRRQFELTWGVVVERTAQHLQQVWQDDILTAGDNLNGWAKIDALQGEKGKVWEFQNSHLVSFVKKTRGGMEIKRLYGTGLTFTPQMVHLLNNGKVGAGSGGGPMTVTVSALPTGVNNDADVKPHLTKLTLQCAAGNIEMDNYNYPIQKKFNWNPAECADVAIQIFIGDLICEKKYTGFNAFNEFMKDFRNGPKTYPKESFPALMGRLSGYRVKSITLGYQFSGQSGGGGGAPSRGPAEVPDRMLVLMD